MRTFLAVVNRRSTAKAAHDTGLTRDAVSRHLRSLEQALGMELLERNFPPTKEKVGRTKRTEAGLTFLPKAAEAVRAFDSLFDDSPSHDPREIDRVLAARLLELAMTALPQDLPDADRLRILQVLAD